MGLYYKPKGAVAKAAEGEAFSVWIMRGDDVGIINNTTKEIKLVTFSKWKAIAEARDLSVSSNAAVRSEVDDACRGLIGAPKAVYIHEGTELTIT